MIFEYALGGTQILHYWSEYFREWRTSIFEGGVTVSNFVSWHTKFALPRVCRQIYYEAAVLVYSKNTFHFGTRRELDHFLNLRKQAQIEAIRTIVLDPHWGYKDPTHCLQDVLPSLGRCKGLRKLCLKRVAWLVISRHTSRSFKEAEDAAAEGTGG